MFTKPTSKVWCHNMTNPIEVPKDSISKQSYGPVIQQSTVVLPLIEVEGSIFIGVPLDTFQIKVPSYPFKLLA